MLAAASAPTALPDWDVQVKNGFVEFPETQKDLRKVASAPTLVTQHKSKKYSAFPNKVSYPYGTRKNLRTAANHSTPSAIFQKTKLCDFYHGKVTRGGVVVPCGRGDSCTFAHDGGDMKPRPDLSKTRFCLSLLQTGSCADPDSCTFAHNNEELRKNFYREMQTGQAEVRRDRCATHNDLRLGRSDSLRKHDLAQHQVGSSQPEVVLGGRELVLDERRPQTHALRASRARRALTTLITQTEAGILIFRRVGLGGDS